MRKTNRTIALLIAMLMVLAFIPFNKVNADVTNDQQINRKTTTNYFTTVVINGMYTNKSGQTFEFTPKTSEEIEGNITDKAVVDVIKAYQDEFKTWATEKGAKSIQFPNEEITDYFYNAHDEITQSNGDKTSTDTILVGDIDDLDNAYVTQGAITIETVLDKHQTYTINASATDNEVIKQVNIKIQAPKAGVEVTAQEVEGEYGAYKEYKPSPVVTAESGAKYKVIDAFYISAYPSEDEEKYDAPFVGTFKENSNCYVEFGLMPLEGYEFSNDTVIKVNGGNEFELNSYSMQPTSRLVYAKIKVGESLYKVLEGANQTVNSSKKQELKFRFNIEYSDFLASGKVYVDEKLVDSKNYTSKEGSTIIEFNQDYIKTLSAGKHSIRVAVADGEVATDFTITKLINPETGDNIGMYIAIFAIATIGLAYIIKKNK